MPSAAMLQSCASDLHWRMPYASLGFSLRQDLPQIHFVAKPYHAKGTHYVPHPLVCGVMHYAWGNHSSSSAVAQVTPALPWLRNLVHR